MQQLIKVLKFTSHLKHYYIAVSALSVILALLALSVPYISGLAIDEIRLGGDGNLKLVLIFAAALFVIDVLSTLISNLGQYLGDLMGVKLQKSLSVRYYEHLLKLPQSYFDSELSGKIISRLSRSITQITRFMIMMSNTFLQFIFSTILALGVIAFLSWQVALLLFTLYPIFIYLTIKSSPEWQKHQKKKNESIDISSGRFAEVINQMKVLKSYGQERREIGSFTEHLSDFVTATKPQSRHWHIQDVKRRFVLNIIFFGVYAFIFSQGVSGDLTPGQAVALVLYSMQIRIPIFTISFLVENTQKAVADSRDYFKILAIPAREEPPIKRQKLKVTKGDIEFNDVEFSYDDNKKIVSGLSFIIPHQKTIALVGESGEGKTTITNLLMRLYLAQGGEISIDGQNIADIPLVELRHNIGTVFQEASLFSGTIRENISYSNPKATHKEVEAAAKAANAHKFVSSLSEGYDTQIGERGLKLSGGQKQRIAIARALLKNAPILILDEATSSLDSKSEHLVQEALDNLMKDRTTIIIAHRLSTIQAVDKIIVIEKGSVSEQGSPKELAKSGGIYSELLAFQAGSSKDRHLKSFGLNS